MLQGIVADLVIITVWNISVSKAVTSRREVMSPSAEVASSPLRTASVSSHLKTRLVIITPNLTETHNLQSLSLPLAFLYRVLCVMLMYLHYNDLIFTISKINIPVIGIYYLCSTSIFF